MGYLILILRSLIFYLDTQISDYEPWIFDIFPQIFVINPWIFNLDPWIFDPDCWIFDIDWICYLDTRISDCKFCIFFLHHWIFTLDTWIFFVHLCNCGLFTNVTSATYMVSKFCLTLQGKTYMSLTLFTCDIDLFSTVMQCSYYFLQNLTSYRLFCL